MSILADSTDAQVVAVVAHGRLLRILLSMLMHHSLHLMSLILHSNTCVNEVEVYEANCSCQYETPTWLSWDMMPSTLKTHLSQECETLAYDITPQNSMMDAMTPIEPRLGAMTHSQCYYYKKRYWASVWGYKTKAYLLVLMKVNDRSHLA